MKEEAEEKTEKGRRTERETKKRREKLHAVAISPLILSHLQQHIQLRSRHLKEPQIAPVQRIPLSH